MQSSTAGRLIPTKSTAIHARCIKTNGMSLAAFLIFTSVLGPAFTSWGSSSRSEVGVSDVVKNGNCCVRVEGDTVFVSIIGSPVCRTILTTLEADRKD